MIEREAEQLTIECLQSTEALEQLQVIWQTLERLDPICTPFNSWRWNALWWQHRARSGDRLALLIVREERRVVAIAPFYLQATRVCKVIALKVLRFIGSGGGSSANYLDIIAVPGRRAAAEHAVMQYLPRIHGWQKMQLNAVRENSTLASRARVFLDGQSGVLLRPSYKVMHKVPLPDTVEGYRAQLSSTECRQLDHRLNELHAAGNCELSICASNEELIEACDALIELHRPPRQSRQVAGASCRGNGEQFHRAVIRQFFSADALWLATLRLDGQLIGVQYIFNWRGELLFMQGGYCPEHESFKPDEVLLGYAIQRGIEQGISGLTFIEGHHGGQPVCAPEEIRVVDIAYLRPGIHGLMGAVHERLFRSIARPVSPPD